MEQGSENTTALANAGKETGASRTPVRVVILSRRVRLIDPDNLCVKFIIDALRYEKLIPGDSFLDVAPEIRQEKVKSKAQEETVITIYSPAS